MDNSSTGSRRSGGSQSLPPDTTPRQYVRHRVDMIIDCLKRANDGMTRDDEARVDWCYVAGQLIGANVFLVQAIDVAEDTAEHGTPQPATADMLDIADDADLLTDKQAQAPTEGGAS